MVIMNIIPIINQLLIFLRRKKILIIILTDILKNHKTKKIIIIGITTHIAKIATPNSQSPCANTEDVETKLYNINFFNLTQWQSKLKIIS